jgi:hypothetical protein
MVLCFGYGTAVIMLGLEKIQELLNIHTIIQPLSG